MKFRGAATLVVLMLLIIALPAAVLAAVQTNVTDWEPVSGAWFEKEGLEGTGRGDAFNLAPETYTDFIFEAKVTFKSGSAAALVFRSNANASQAYVANIDRDRADARIFKFPARGDFELGTVPIERKDTYHLKVRVSGDHIQYFIDGELVIDVHDSTYAAGQIGLNVFASTVVFDNIYVQEL